MTLPEAAACSLRVQETLDTNRFDLADSTLAILSRDAPPLAPRVVIAADTAQVVLLWPRVAHAMDYRIEQSADFRNWEIIAVTADTSYTQPLPALPFVRRYFRVISQR